MNTRILYLFCLCLAGCVPPRSVEHTSKLSRPNIIIIFTDDQGYNDLSCYGATDITTPNIDRMAAEGVRFTSFYDAQPVCSASRAALLTGCYPTRVGIAGALFPNSPIGLNPQEETIADICKANGYKTAIMGKWHLGDHRDFMPLRHGFDEFFGIPYSNDMSPSHPNKTFNFPPLPLYENDSVISYFEDDQSMLTTQITERAVSFIEKNKGNPFFLYVAHPMPHVPIFVSEKFRGKSARGIYGDVVMEIDWSVGEILHAVKRHGLDENTLVIFTSDNGPWLSYGAHAGSAHPLREGKGTVFEGGVRVPFIMRWPGRIGAGTVQHEPAMNIDILPTICHILDVPLPVLEIDGKSIWSLAVNVDGIRNPHDAYAFYYKSNELQAIRRGKWKLYFPHTYQSLAGGPGGMDGKPADYKQVETGLALYDLEADPSETINVAETNSRVVDELEYHALLYRLTLGDGLQGITGAEVRAPGRSR
jgi:arylsulfatase A-like enzyme